MTAQVQSVVIIGQPGWQNAALAAIEVAGYTPHLDVPEPGLVARLVAARAALVLIAAEVAEPRWRWALTAPGVNAATRRLPLVVISADPNLRIAAYRAGADVVLTPALIPSVLPGLIARLAYAPDEVYRAELERQCAEPLPAEALEALRQFNTGEYYHQHDSFEVLWMAEPGPVRDLYQGVLQVGIAYYQVTLGRRRAALKMLLRARQWLARLPGRCRGVDVAGLRAAAAEVQAALEALPEDDDLSTFDRALLRPIRYEVPSHHHSRADDANQKRGRT